MTDFPVDGRDPSNPQCGAEHPCRNDHDEPCFCGPVGPERRRIKVRPSARFVQQVRALGERRYPLAPVSADPTTLTAFAAIWDEKKP